MPFRHDVKLPEAVRLLNFEDEMASVLIGYVNFGVRSDVVAAAVRSNV